MKEVAGASSPQSSALCSSNVLGGSGGDRKNGLQLWLSPPWPPEEGKSLLGVLDVRTCSVLMAPLDHLKALHFYRLAG